MPSAQKPLQTLPILPASVKRHRQRAIAKMPLETGRANQYSTGLGALKIIYY